MLRIIQSPGPFAENLDTLGPYPPAVRYASSTRQLMLGRLASGEAPVSVKERGQRSSM